MAYVGEGDEVTGIRRVPCGSTDKTICPLVRLAPVDLLVCTDLGSDVTCLPLLSMVNCWRYAGNRLRTMLMGVRRWSGRRKSCCNRCPAAQQHRKVFLERRVRKCSSISASRPAWPGIVGADGDHRQADGGLHRIAAANPVQNSNMLAVSFQLATFWHWWKQQRNAWQPPSDCHRVA